MASPPESRKERLRGRVRQLILMRETGPKRSGWHQARMRMIWQLHDQIRAEEHTPLPPEPQPDVSRS